MTFDIYGLAVDEPMTSGIQGKPQTIWQHSLVFTINYYRKI
jgi:hypothetical protein